MSIGLPRHSKAVSRADLVQWLLESGEKMNSLAQMAAFAGFQQVDEPLLKRQDQPKREQSILASRQITTTVINDAPPVIASAGRISACWFRVVSRQRLESQQDQEGREANEPLSIRGVGDFTQDDLTPAANLPSALQSLLSWARLWPVMKGHLSTDLSGRVDIPRLTEQVARGRLLDVLPRLRRLHWADEAIILLDFNQRVLPFWDDFQQLLGALGRLRGKNGLDLREQTGLPGLHYTVSNQPEQGVKTWSMPATDTPMLILSDLGMLEVSGTLRKHWLRFGRELKAAGLQPFVLAPVSPQHIDPELSRYYHVALWDRSSSLLRQQQRAETNSKEQLEQLFALLSPASRIEPELLRAVRHLLADTTFDAGLEAEFWQHPAVERSSIACALRSEYAETSRQKFKEQPPELQREVLKLIRQHHARLFPSVMHYETLLWAVLVSDNLADEFKTEIEQAALFLRRTAKMLYTQREYLDDSRKAHGKRTLDSSHEELLRKHLCLAVFEGVVNAEQAAKGLPLRPGIDRLELERTLAKSSSQTRECVLYQHGDELLLAEKDTSTLPGSLIADITLTHDLLSIQSETTDGQQTGKYFQWDLGSSPDKGAKRRVEAAGRLGGVSLTALGQDIQSLTLRSGNETLTLQTLTKPGWAHRIGRDSYGLWAEIEVKGITQRCRWIAPGTFQMGSPESEKNRGSNETQHEVTLTQGYWLADTACTQVLWETVMGNNPARFKDDKNNPVEQVSWDDAQEFFKQLNKLVPGLDAYLPSEAQWEYACRAGTTTPFSFGANITPEQVNYDGNYPYANGKKGLYREKTVPVKSLPASSWGLYEMHGNVYEWCQDWLGDYPAEPVADPAGVETGSDRVLRGGSWLGLGGGARSANRYRLAPADRRSLIGFRFAPGQASSRAVEPPNQQERTAQQRTAA